jgi:hypothetical protein
MSLVALPNGRSERTGGQPGHFTAAPVTAGRSTASWTTYK